MIRFDSAQTLDEIVNTPGLLKYNSLDVEAQVAVVQYQAVIPYLVETDIWRILRLNQGHQE